MASTQEKVNEIKELAEAAGWVDNSEQEQQLEAARNWIPSRAALSAALTKSMDESRAAKGLPPRSEATQRISYRHPTRGEHINLHVELLDGKIHSAAFNYFDKPPVTALTGIIRLIHQEASRKAWLASSE